MKTSRFGGVLYLTGDPSNLLIVTMSLGPGYVVWDNADAIDRLKLARAAA